MADASSFRSSLPFLLRVLGALLLVSLVPLLIASWRLISVNRDSMELQVKATQTVAVRTAADAISTFLETRRALARSIAESPILGSADATSISTLLQGSLQAWSNLEVEALGLFDAQSRMLLGTRVSGSQLELIDWVDAQPVGGASMELEAERVVVIVREPLSSGGSVLLIGGTTALTQPLEPSQLIDDSGAHIAVFDRDGVQLAGTVADGELPTDLLDLALSGTVEGSGMYGVGAETVIAAYSPIAETDWTVVATQPRAVAERVAVRMRERAITSLALALGIIALLVFIAYRSLVRPLRELLVAQRKLAKSRALADGGGNLIQQLQRSFEDLEQRMEDQKELGEVFLGRYQVLELVGRGGMGAVFRGWDPELERYVALKTVRFDKLETSATDLVQALLQEAKTTARMQHSHVVQVFDVAAAKRAAFIAMEFVDGISAEAWIQRGLPPAQSVVPVVRGTAEGILAAHRHDILHRDIKAANVLLGYDGSIKVTDFGLAKAVSAQTESSDTVFGTPGHIAPEVLLGKGLDKPSDLFALGVVLHYMLTGYTPFRGTNVKETLRKTLDGKVSRPSNLRPEIPLPLEDLLLELLAKSPQDRPDAEATVERLRAIEQELQIHWQAPAREDDLAYMPQASSEFVATQQIQP